MARVLGVYDELRTGAPLGAVAHLVLAHGGDGDERLLAAPRIAHVVRLYFLPISATASSIELQPSLLERSSRPVKSASCRRKRPSPAPLE